jgi:acyl-CoA thioester hydrolase
LRIGITPAYLRDNARGMAAVDQHIEYKRELRAGDVVTVRSQVLELHDKKIRFRHHMRNDQTGEVAAVTTLLGLHMDTQSRKSCPFPPELLARARALPSFA